MKYFPILFLCVFLSCNSSANQKVAEIDNKETLANNFSGTTEERLAQMIRRAGNGALVSQRGGNYYVKIRGASDSFQSDSRPLYVVNGVSLGNDFNTVAGSIAGNEIRSVKILKGQKASFYGVRGANGVIEIKTGLPELN